MHLSRKTDYGLRLLIQLSLAEQPLSVAHVAETFGVSDNHLAKVAHELRRLGYVEPVRGRSGGYVIAQRPEDISVGEVVEQLEDLTLVECFGADNTCPISNACLLAQALEEARGAFLQVLSEYSLGDLIGFRGRKLRRLLQIA